MHGAITTFPSLPGQGCDVNKRRSTHLCQARIETGLTDCPRRNVLDVSLPQ